MIENTDVVISFDSFGGQMIKHCEYIPESIRFAHYFAWKGADFVAENFSLASEHKANPTKFCVEYLERCAAEKFNRQVKLNQIANNPVPDLIIGELEDNTKSTFSENEKGDEVFENSLVEIPGSSKEIDDCRSNISEHKIEDRREGERHVENENTVAEGHANTFTNETESRNKIKENLDTKAYDTHPKIPSLVYLPVGTKFINGPELESLVATE